MFGYIWVCLGMYGYVWLPMDIMNVYVSVFEYFCICIFGLIAFIMIACGYFLYYLGCSTFIMVSCLTWLIRSQTVYNNRL